MSTGKQAYKKFGWVIKNFPTLQSEKCYSLPVLISDCKWRLVAYPNGKYLSMFLEVVDFESMPRGWGRYVTLRLNIVNQSPPYHSIVQEKKCRFDCKSTTSGFQMMVSLSKLHGFLVNGEVMIFAELDCYEVVGTLDSSEKSEEPSELLSKKKGRDGTESNDLLKKTSPVKESNDVSGAKQESFIASMAKQVGKKFLWVIKDFYFPPFEKCYSDSFMIGAFNCYLVVECDLVEFFLCLFIEDSQTLPSEDVKVGLTIVNQLDEKLSFLTVSERCFDDDPAIGFAIPYRTLAKLPGFLVNGELMILAEVIGASDVFEESIPLGMSEVNGFHVLPSQVQSVRRIFDRHPDIAVEFRAKNQHLRTTFMNFLLSLVETLYQPLQELSNEDLVEADIALTYLKDVGFKVHWLEEKLGQLKEKKEKERFCEARVQEMEAQLLDLKLKFEAEKAELSGTRAPLSFDDFV